MYVLSTFRKTTRVVLHMISRFVLLGSLLIVPGMGALPTARAQGQERQPKGVELSVGAPVEMDTAALQVMDSAAPAPTQVEEVFNLPADAKRYAAQKKRAQDKAARLSKAPVSDLAAEEDAGASEMGPALAPLESDGANGLTPLDPTATGSFIGLDENGRIPPDTMIAAGPSNLVEVVNDEIAVFNKSGGLASGPFTLQTWFGRAATDRVFDPTVIYRGGRFYVVALFKNTTTQVSQILLSASRTSDAAGTWCNYTFNGEQATTNWADFPRIGATQNRILIATNQFTWAGDIFQNNFLHELPKGPIDACAAFDFTTWFDFSNSDSTRGFTLNPVLDYDAFSTSAFQLVNSISGSGSVITVWRRNVAAATWTRFNISTAAYSTPPDARQPGTATRVATNDSRILSAVKRYNKIWAIHTSALNPGCGFNIAVVHVIAINAPASTTTAPTANHNLHYHGGCTFDYYFPAITVDGNGNMLMVFNRSSTGERPNVRFAGWHAASFPNQTTLIGGGGYFASGRVGLAPGAFTETRLRWGDYSGISLDPVSPQQNVWVAGEILSGNNFWTTQVGKIFHSPVPSSP
jgi:hypothetical protein